MKSLPSVKLPRSHHSSLWVWLILLVILLSGVMYLGFKINQRNALIAATKINSQKTNVYSHDAAADSKHVLQILRAQGLVGQSIYKTKIFLPDANLNSTASDREGQQQVVMVDATVRIAVDLNELKTQSTSHKNPQSISLPRARIVAVQVDSVTSYDIKTGQPSTVQLGLSRTHTQSQSITAQIKRDVCTTGMLQIATEASRQHVVALLDLMHIPMIVQATAPAICSKSKHWRNFL